MRVAPLIVIAALTVSISGCRIKSWESFESAVTPNPPGEWKGDPYASAGLANATGGLRPGTRYAEGAKNTDTKVDAKYDTPAKGTGLHPGEPTVSTRNGHGLSNAPAFQDTPGSLGNPANRAIR
ncbi:MAG: hypothetical protein SFX74_05535 [Fimbriimonadaceae bacterium]|nr:hypothetical protein [Fimbriimonadaceae bacterium]